MGKHEKPADGSDGDGRVELDEVDLAELLKERGGQHSAEDDENDE
jgi:hypothetical protein